MSAALVPAADAHTCRAEDPEQSCGECLAGDHDHTYNDGRNYCYSGDPVCDAWSALGLGGRCEPILS